MDILTAVIVAFITAVIGPVVMTWVKTKLERKKHDPLAEAIEHNALIDHQVDSLFDQLDCDRIWISQFHNGGHLYPTGKSLQKFSILYERVGVDVASVKEVYQNIPTSLFSKAFSTLYREGEINLPHYDADKAQNLFPVDKSCGTKSFYALAIHDLQDQFIGVLVIDYVNENHTLTLEEWIFIRQKVGAIGTLLSNYLKNKK
jgi:hypothetical protein